MDELTALLIAAGCGDRMALSTFVRRTQPDVWRFCARLVDPGTADDITQEVYVRVMKAAGGFRGDASARTWLFSIARRTCADELRRRRRHRTTEPAAAAASEPSQAGFVDLTLLLDGLDPPRREAFVLTQLVGMSYAEAAEVCEVPVGTIRSRVARAREQLVAALHRSDVATG